jgi:hypothetical protein
MDQQVRSRKKSRGQGLVEFALIVPILLLLIFGIIDFGWIMFNYSQIYNGLREATRYGSVVGFSGTSQIVDCSGIRSRLITTAQFSGIRSSDINIWYDDGRGVADDVVGTTQSSVVGTCSTAFTANVTTNYVCQGSPSCLSNRITPLVVENGDRIVIDVNVSIHFITPFINAFAPGGIPMHLRSTRSIFPTGLAG